MSTPCFRPRRCFVSSGTTSWLVGPGIGDNAAAVVVAMHVVGELLSAQKVAPGALVFTVGEEGLGNLRGITAACAELEPEAVVAVEGHGLEHVIVDAVGSLRASVRVTGPGGHSWVDRGRPSAIHALLELGASLARESSTDVPVNVGLVSGGRSVNTIAGEAELAVEARALDEAALDRFADAARAPRGERSASDPRRDDRQTTGGTARSGFASPRGRPGGAVGARPSADARRGVDRRERGTCRRYAGSDHRRRERRGHAHARGAHRRGALSSSALPSSMASCAGCFGPDGEPNRYRPVTGL